MKKILIVNIGTEIGGIEKCLMNFLNYLVGKDCTVDVAFWKPAGPLYSQIPKEVNILSNRGVGSFKDAIKSASPKRIINYIRFKQLSKAGVPWKALPIMDTEYDLAISYCQNGYSPYYVIDNVKAKEKLLWYHELNYTCEGDKKDFDYKYFSQYTKICAVSQACKNNLCKAFPELKEKIIAIYNLYNDQEIITKSQMEIPEFSDDKKTIVTVGRLSQEKGVELAINACHQLSKIINNFVWYWVGDGDMHQTAQNLISSLGIEDCFVLLGNKNNPYPYMKNADVYVQPSLSEAFCTTVVEAKVLSKPIVSTDVDSVFEQLEHGKNALICGKNADELAYAISSIINDKELQNLFVQNLSTENINDLSSYDKLLFS